MRLIPRLVFRSLKPIIDNYCQVTMGLGGLAAFVGEFTAISADLVPACACWYLICLVGQFMVALSVAIGEGKCRVESIFLAS